MITIRDYGIYNTKYEQKYSQKEVNTDPSEVQICRTWLQQFARPKRIKKDDCIGSYGLKHEIERRVGQYVSNGACIQAAIELGYNFWHRSGGINAHFYMELILPEDQWKRERPTKFSRWLFNQSKRNDPIGDLARDAQSDSTWPRRAEKFIDFWSLLQKEDASDNAIEALAKGWREFSGKEPPIPTYEILVNCDDFYEGLTDEISFTESYPSAPSNGTYIYVLYESGLSNRRAKYVGQATQPTKRLQQHITCPGSIEKLLWTADLIKRDKYPKMAIIDLVDKSEASQLEQCYIYALY